MVGRATTHTALTLIPCSLAAAMLLGAAACRPPAVGAGRGEPLDATASSDTTEARRVFEENIRAIHRRDRERYLSLYLVSPDFARNGPGGLELGYATWAARRDTTWPDTLVARDLRVVPVAPGVVYGTYQYRVTQRGVTSEGISERVFVRTPDGWRIAVSTAFGLPPHAYLNGRRVDLARRLLLAGRRPADVASAAGFYDQPHLNRVFRRYLSTSPGRYISAARRLR
jgi:hypothetical protein